MKAWVLLFLGVGLIGTICDQIHVQFAVLTYPAPFLLGQAFWVPILFGASGVLLAASYVPLARLAPRDEPRPSRLAFLLAALTFVAAYFATGIWKGSPVPLAVGLTLAWIAILAARFSLDRLVFGIAVAAGGVAVETALSSAGGFHYSVAKELGRVPIWLPALYLHVAVLTRVIARTFFVKGGGAVRVK
jgi:hypothetical protein